MIRDSTMITELFSSGQAAASCWDLVLLRIQDVGYFFSLFSANLCLSLVGSAPSTLVGITLGVVLFIVAGIYECYTKRDCLFPPTMFKNVTAGKCCLDGPSLPLHLGNI